MIQPRSILSVLCCSVLVLVGAFQLSAQTPGIVEATIPFDFWIEGSHLPAGVYQIEHIDSSTYFVMRSNDGKSAHDVYTLPLDEGPIKEQDAKLVFRIEKGRYYLYGGSGPFGRRVVTAESARPAPSGDAKADVPIVFRGKYLRLVATKGPRERRRRELYGDSIGLLDVAAVETSRLRRAVCSCRHCCLPRPATG